MTSELDNARRCLSDAELYAGKSKNDPEKSQAYVAIANAWLRMEEIKTQKNFVLSFDRKSFR